MASLYTACKLSPSCSFLGRGNSHQLSSMTGNLGAVETETFFKTATYLENRDHSVLLGYCKCLQRPERVLMQCPMVGVVVRPSEKTIFVPHSLLHNRGGPVFTGLS